ncbi:MAG: hypothetical protein OXI20_20920 [Rhodospirillales bacterium]|nr:hypothetical protein [Rhodospirillales bacterium]
MRSKHPLLPIAVALAACLWTSDAMAQAGTIPVTPNQESRPAAHAGIATHDTGDRPGTGELPGTGDRPGAGKRPGSEELFGTAQPAAGVDLDAAAELRQQALAAMETLREEIATLTALKHAQAALLAWNRGLAEADEGPATLAGALCAEPAIDAWCALLPATFGNPHTEGGHDRD